MNTSVHNVLLNHAISFNFIITLDKYLLKNISSFNFKKQHEDLCKNKLEHDYLFYRKEIDKIILDQGFVNYHL